LLPGHIHLPEEKDRQKSYNPINDNVDIGPCIRNGQHGFGRSTGTPWDARVPHEGDGSAKGQEPYVGGDGGAGDDEDDDIQGPSDPCVVLDYPMDAEADGDLDRNIGPDVDILEEEKVLDGLDLHLRSIVVCARAQAIEAERDSKAKAYEPEDLAGGLILSEKARRGLSGSLVRRGGYRTRPT
jgi:hypothetical protein